MKIATSPHVKYAGFWRRFAGAWLDALVLMPAYIPYWIISATKGQNNPVSLWGLVVALVVSAIYFTLMESSESGATFGKKWVGIRVLDIEGHRISKPKAFSRWISHVLSYITLYVGFLIQPFTSRKQALHDLVVGTVIVDTEKAKSNSRIVIAIPILFAGIFILGIIAAIAIPAYQNHNSKSQIGWTAIDNERKFFVDYSKVSKDSNGYFVIPKLANHEPIKSNIDGYYWQSTLSHAVIDCGSNRIMTPTESFVRCTNLNGAGTCLTLTQEFQLQNANISLENLGWVPVSEKYGVNKMVRLVCGE